MCMRLVSVGIWVQLRWWMASDLVPGQFQLVNRQQPSPAIGRVIDDLFALDMADNLMNVEVCKAEILSNALS